MHLFDYVEFQGEKYYLEDGVLYLNAKGIQNLKEIQNLANLKSIKELHLQSNNIKDIDGLENLRSLKKLQLNDNNIENIFGLKNLENLEELDLSNNNIYEIKGLKNLRNLKILDLYNNHIKKISGLENQINLINLILSKNQINYLDGLDSLVNLERLVLSSNEIIKIEGLEQLKNLKEIYLGTNNIKKIEGLNTLTNLEILDIRDNPIKEICGLESLSSLQELKFDQNILPPSFRYFGKSGKHFVKYCRGEYVISNNNIVFVEESVNGYKDLKNILQLSNIDINTIFEIRNLNNLTYLEVLNLVGNNITEIEGLESLKKIKLLWLSHNKIKEIKGLHDLYQLEYLALNSNEIEQIEGLETLVNLKKLNLKRNDIKKIEGLNKLDKLLNLSLSHNKIENIENDDIPIKLEVLSLSGNKIGDNFSGIKNLTKLKKLALYDCQIDNLENISELKDLEVLNLGNNNITEINALNNLLKLKELNLAYNNIHKIYGLSKLKDLKSLSLENNKISEIEGLENLTNLTSVNLDGNLIDNDLYKNLKLSNNRPNLFVSYCILKPEIEGMKDKIIWSDFIKKNPYLEDLTYDQFGQILNCIRYVIVLRENESIASIETPESLVQNFDDLIRPYKIHEEIPYTYIVRKLKLKDENSTKKLSEYIIKHRLSEHNLYDKEKGVSKTGSEIFNYQLAIFDVPNQRTFFKKGVYNQRLKELENFLSTQKGSEVEIIKLAFINTGSLSLNAAGYNYLDKHLGWTIITNFKEKSTDIDTKIASFTMQLSNLYLNDWDKIFVISSDADIVEYFRKTFDQTSSTKLFFITDIDNNYLDYNNNLLKITDHQFEINIYTRKD